MTSRVLPVEEHWKMRPWTDADTRTLLAWMKQEPGLASDMGGYEQGVAETIALRQQQAAQGQAAIYAVDADDGQLAVYVTVYPLVEDTGVVHFCIAPELRGQGAALFHWTVEMLAFIGVKHLIAPPSPRLDPKLQQRVWRRMGFTTNFYGEHYA